MLIIPPAMLKATVIINFAEITSFGETGIDIAILSQ